jgi:ferredoxin
MIDGKARLLGDLFCDGLGACLGHCPEGAITIEEREAVPYEEKTVMVNVVKQGKNTIIAHLRHLKDHGETGYLNQALEYLKENNIAVDFEGGVPAAPAPIHQRCPGSRTMQFAAPARSADEGGKRESALGHWPIQLHLISPNAPQYRNADLLLAADCVAFSMGDFHKDYLKGKALAIGCPKLDDGLDVYQEKLTALIDEANVNTITVMIMQVPCCGGLLHLAKAAAAKAKRKIPVKAIVVGLQGEILKEEWV